MKLPLACEIDYYPNFLSSAEANTLFDDLSEIVEVVCFKPQTSDGKEFEVSYTKITFLDQDLLDENKFPEIIWGPTQLRTHKLNRLKNKIESLSRQEFAVCVLIYYPNGNTGVDFHSDLIAYGDTSIIPSISLGEEREFAFRAKHNGNEWSKELKNGSLIVCQERYEQSLITNKKYKNPRINLTFRKYGFDD
ncbi:MAG: alpha-ketoglutarate-dependent dioxygenase AlkB [Vicingaceae bacterium]